MKKGVGRPRGSGPAQLIIARFAEEICSAFEHLEQNGTPISKLLADQLEQDPLGTVENLRHYLVTK